MSCHFLTRKIYLLCIVLFVAVHYVASAQNFGKEIENLGRNINTQYHELNPVISVDMKTLFFVRRGDPKGSHGVDGEDIFYSESLGENKWSEAKPISNLNIAKYNAVLSISKDGNRLLLNSIFTSQNKWKKRGLSISKKLADGQWSNPVPLPIPKLSLMNRGRHTSGVWSQDENTIILSFSSKIMSDSSDLYLIQKKSDSTWSQPQKIVVLCSERSEEAPFLSADGITLYFSSDREGPTPGKFDIYKSTRTSEDWKAWSPPEKDFFSLNSPAWDSSLKILSNGEYAYFCTDQKGFGGVDIFAVDLLGRSHADKNFAAVLLDSATRKPLIGKVFLLWVDDKLVEEVTVQLDSAKFNLPLKSNRTYDLLIKVDGAYPKHEIVKMGVDSMRKEIFIRMKPTSGQSLTVANEARNKNKKEVLQQPFDVNQNDSSALANPPVEIKVKDSRTGKNVTYRVNPDDAKVTKIVFNNILFQFAKSRILPSSQYELQTLYEFMKNNPTKFIRAEGHTSSEGKLYFNNKLSQDRALAVQNYLLGKGISKNRIRTKGFGPKHPVADNDTEEGRKLNRRVEISVIE